jgi:DNA-binding MarR family transcriptional regulator
MAGIRAKSLSLSHLRILVALHEAAASGGTTAAQLAEQTGYSRAASHPNCRATPSA